MAERQKEVLTVASRNTTKLRRVQAAFATHPYIEARPLYTERPEVPELGPFESSNAEAKARAGHLETGGYALGWDDGMYLPGHESPGPNIKRLAGEGASAQDILDYYRDRLSAIPEEQRRGEILRAIAVVAPDGTAYHTIRRIKITFDLSRTQAVPDTNPLDAIIIPDGFDKPFAEFSPEERGQYDRTLAEGVQSLVDEARAQSIGIDTRHSLRHEGRVWVFSDPRMHLFTNADARGIAEMSGALRSHYNGHPEGWVIEKYGTTGNDDVDPNGFFTTRRNLFVFGEPGKPVGMLAFVGKRGGAIKTNTLRVAESHQGSGVGKAMKREMIEMAKALGVRKLYCTTSLENDAALGLNLSLGYQQEALLPGQYHPDRNEVVLGLVLRPGERSTRAEGSHMLLPETGVAATVRTVSPSADYQQVAALFDNLNGWHNDLGDDFVEHTLAGAQRGVEDIQGKGKLMLVSETADGQINGSVVITGKMGGPAKFYPLIGSETAQRQLLTEGLAAARKLGFRIAYTFSPVWDEAQSRLLEEHGFIARGTLREPYKPGADLVAWTLPLE